MEKPLYVLVASFKDRMSSVVSKSGREKPRFVPSACFMAFRDACSIEPFMKVFMPCTQRLIKALARVCRWTKQEIGVYSAGQGIMFETYHGRENVLDLVSPVETK